MERPETIFNREWEWDRLTRFAADETEGATLGLVLGRRRQGKSLLLEELCAAMGGFYFAATQATEHESLQLLGEALAAHLGLGVPLALQSWERALDALLGLGAQRQLPIVLDEFPYLVDVSPQLPSVIQKAFGPRRKERVESRSRIILCGSAVSFMRELLTGAAPLRGRVSLDLAVHTFDHRTAALFWGLTDWPTALKVHAIVGGTPAYRREFVRDDVPRAPQDFDAWVVRTALDPACPLFREARYLLAEGEDMRQASLYHSVLAAVAEGHTTRRAIAQYSGRKDDTLGHPLGVLEDAGLLNRDEDVFRKARSSYRISEPLIAFYHAVMRPEWARLERPGRAVSVWAEARPRFASNILGPHFESICREWARHFAADSTFGQRPVRIGSGLINDPARRMAHQVDVAVLGMGNHLLSIGEVKYGRAMDVADLARLRHIRGLLAAARGESPDEVRLALYSAAGFSSELRRLARDSRGSILLIDLDRIYAGD